MSFDFQCWALEDAGGSWLGFEILIWFWYNHLSLIQLCSKFGSLSWIWRCKEHPCNLSPDFGYWWGLEVPDGGFAFLYSFWYCHWSLIQQYSNIWLSIFNLKVQRTFTSFKSRFGDLVKAGDSWLEFSIFIFIWIWSWVFGTIMFKILPLYLHFEGEKNIHVLWFLI